MPTDWYAILELEPTATASEIRSAYRKKALRSHPDRAPAGEKEQATAQFKMIAEAYEVLGDDRRRWEYDRFEYPLVNGSMPADAFDMHASTSPSGHSFVWESSFDSARRAQQGRYGPDGFPRGAFDPFELFNSMFARDFHEMEAESSFSGAQSAFMDDPFASMRGGFGNSRSAFGHDAFGGVFGNSPSGSPFGAGASPFSLLHGFPPTHTTNARGNSSFASSSNVSMFNSSSGMGGESETRRTTVVNGHRETVITKRDAQGNETVRRITPQGETIYINGQLQPALEAPKHPAVDSVANAENDAASDTSQRSDTTSTARRKKWKLF
ncbi:hypothetical protein GLX27_001500 [Malassezia furfur]|uniref:J domain-containing protein n=1 Tax=Malassezia furfur TaxID=55194 RepID=A0ABY8EMX7_MALFU|nr:hypothetical protein CBS14141_000836 [Malassezia furfur]WFD46858.1 hypothetical protein GLX27_001500 [Malassezia furfur]